MLLHAEDCDVWFVHLLIPPLVFCSQDGLNVTFLTFFSGVIDKFHLSKSLVGDDWATKYSPGQKLMARILYVDPVEKRAGLSLAKHLLEQAPARLPKLGKVYDAAVVRRIDPSVGLLLELPGKQGAPPVAGFAHVSNISESQIKKLEKEFKQVLQSLLFGKKIVVWALATRAMRIQTGHAGLISFASSENTLMFHNVSSPSELKSHSAVLYAG